MLQPRFCKISAGSQPSQLLRRQSLCIQSTSRGVVSAAERRRSGDADQVDPEIDAKAQADQYADDESKSPVTADNDSSVGVRIALSVLRFYKREISPILPPSCRFIPTCSEYAMDSFKQHGVARGFVLTTWRLLRCNPFGAVLSFV